MKFLKTAAAMALLAMFTSSFAQVTQMKVSTQAPAGITNPPQFIVIGSDDNYSTEGLNWMTNLINNGGPNESAGTNKDGSPRYMSFYVNSDNDGGPWENTDGLPDAVLNAYTLGNEVSNHTTTHMRFVGGDSWSDPDNMVDDLSIRRGIQDTYNEMNKISNDLIELGIPKEHQYGFRTPFLTYSDTTYTAMQQIGFLYDCSINAIGEAGSHNFPYTLDDIHEITSEEWSQNPIDNIAPDGKSWWGRGNSNDNLGEFQNPIREHKGLWTIPCSQVQIAAEDQEWIKDKIVNEEPVIVNGQEVINADTGRPKNWKDFPNYILIPDDPNAEWIPTGHATGLDYNLWEEAWLDSAQSVRALMNTLQKALDGNRAPFAYGMHSQYYFAEDGTYNGLTQVQTQGIMEEFVRQASQLDDVFFVSGDMVIAWMENPCEAEDFNPADYHRSNPDRVGAKVPEGTGPTSINKKAGGSKTVSSAAFAGIRNGQVNLQLNAGNYSVELYNLKGRLIRKSDINAKTGLNAVNMKTEKLSKGVFVLNVKQNGVSVLNNKITIK